MPSRSVNLTVQNVVPALIAICMIALPFRSGGADQPPSATKDASVAAPPPTPPATVARSRADCERYAAVLVGRGDRKLLDDPAVQELARQVPDLVTCGAVLSKSETLCAALGEASSQCRKRWSMVEDLLANPKQRTFIFSERDYKSCAADKTMAPFCDGFRAAVTSRDPGKCPRGKFASVCRAIVSLDKSMCDQAAKDPEGSAELRDWCVEAIDMCVPFAGGLDALAKSKPSLERDLARAALRTTDACAEYEKQAVKTCLK